MSLSTYDNEKGCFVLKDTRPPANAFDWRRYNEEEKARTGGLKLAQMNTEANKGKGVTAYLEKRRETNPSHGTFFGMSEKEASPRVVGKLVRK
jgi:hypothetical protein